MPPASRCIVLVAACVGVFSACLTYAKPFRWMKYDNFDRIMDKFDSVTAHNCRSKPKSQLTINENGIISQLPRYNLLRSTVMYSNRSNLLHMHNLALNRAFYFSFIYQKLNSSVDFYYQPGFQYIYMSVTADVTGSAGFINGSGIFFDWNCSYPNWYSNLDFNRTLPLFGPKSWRADDYNEPTNWLREPTNNTIEIHDLGAGRHRDYSNPAYKGNDWYNTWLPDSTNAQDTLKKYTYSVGIKYSNSTGHFVDDEFVTTTFFGPPQPGQQERDHLPVIFSKPYFDCGRSNKWIVSATSPVVEYMVRYSNYTHLRRAKFVAVVSMDLEFERIDFNPCPESDGNPGPNFLGNIARCKPSTLCEPLHGWGFRRGGYQCTCKPGFRFPWYHDGPFLGVEIEQATEEEYRNSFDCYPVDFMQVIPKEMPTWVQKRKKRLAMESYDTPKERFLRTLFPESHESVRLPIPLHPAAPKVSRKRRFVPRFAPSKKIKEVLSRKKRFVPKKRAAKSRKKRDLFDYEARLRMKNLLERKSSTTPSNCGARKLYELSLPGDAGFGVEKEFEAQGRTALRLAHFLSDFLQNVDEYETFGVLKGDRRLNETQIFGEVIANVMSDFKIRGSGVFFDRYRFRMSPPIDNVDPRFVNGITREYFGPFAWRYGVDNEGLDEFKAIDYAGFKQSYVDERWFRDMKTRWATNYYHLKKFTAKPLMRSDHNGSSSIRFEYYPLTYKAPSYSDGEWLRPRFKCDKMVDAWVVTYVVPFFGLSGLKSRIEFKGVVTVDVDLDYLDIKQCPSNFYEANAFKNTAKCDFESTYCVHIPGLRFMRGGYKCECKQSYEYPFNDLAWYFDGQTMEEEYRKFMINQENRFETLKCRIAAAGSFKLSWFLLLLGLITAKCLQLRF